MTAAGAAMRQRVLRALLAYVAANGYAPTLSELGDLVGLASRSTVLYHLRSLEREGYIRRMPGTRQALQILPQPAPAPDPPPPPVWVVPQ